MICFWTTGISYIGMETPISPRAIIMPSDTSIISSMFLIPGRFSILAIILQSLSLPLINFLIARISNLSLTNDWAMKSTLFYQEFNIAIVYINTASWLYIFQTPLVIKRNAFLIAPYFLIS